MKALFLAGGLMLVTAIPLTVQAECVTDEDCREDRICKNKQCVDKQECSKDADCPEDHVCKDNTCKPTEKEEGKEIDSKKQKEKNDSIIKESPESSEKPSVHEGDRRSTEHKDKPRRSTKYMGRPSRSYGPYFRPGPKDAYPSPGTGFPEPRLSWYNSFYFVFGASVLMHGWGEMGGEPFKGDMSEDDRGGVYLGLYKASSQYFHIGCFFTYNKGDSKVKLSDHDEWTDETTYYTYKFHTELIAAGLSAKIGAPYSRRVWIGGAFDLGYAKPFMEYWSMDAVWHGLYLAGRFNVDILGFQLNGVKVGLSLGLGVEAVPFSKGKIMTYPHEHDDEEQDVKSELWTVRLQFLLALVIGS